MTDAMYHILVVDDDTSILNLLPRVLTGHRVSVAHSGPEALANLDLYGPIDLLVTDFMMPLMTGDELIGLMGAVRPGIRTLILSAHIDLLMAARPECLAETHLMKPFQVDHLRELVTKMLTKGAHEAVIWPS